MVLRCLIIIASAMVGGCQPTTGQYAADCSAPLEGWRTQADGIGHLMVVFSVKLSSDGAVRLNNVPVNDRELEQELAMVDKLNPLPQLVLEVDPASNCLRVEEVRSLMNRAQLCREGYCSEGRNPELWEEVGGP
jgi:hypothetical protein